MFHRCFSLAFSPALSSAFSQLLSRFPRFLPRGSPPFSDVFSVFYPSRFSPPAFLPSLCSLAHTAFLPLLALLPFPLRLFLRSSPAPRLFFLPLSPGFSLLRFFHGGDCQVSFLFSRFPFFLLTHFLFFPFTFSPFVHFLCFPFLFLESWISSKMSHRCRCPIMLLKCFLLFFYCFSFFFLFSFVDSVFLSIASRFSSNPPFSSRRPLPSSPPSVESIPPLFHRLDSFLFIAKAFSFFCFFAFSFHQQAFGVARHDMMGNNWVA